LFNLAALEMMRSAEIEVIVHYFRPGARVLEIGAGTGQQALAISRRGFTVEAIEIASSGYSEARVYPIIDYDGTHLPFPDASFDVVFSSNVLEHVPDVSQLNREISRVLKPDGFAVHVMPTPSWRIWTTATSIPAALQYALASRASAGPHLAPAGRPPPSLLDQLRRHFGRHGDHGSVVSELWLFHPRRWRRIFQGDGFVVIGDRPVGIFYSGNTVLGTRLSIAHRKSLARWLGSSGHIYVVKQASPLRAKDR
jgi:SAM-dependent methyltransferase